MSHLIKKFISSIPIEIVAILLIIAIPAIGVTVLSSKVSKNFTNYVSKASPSPLTAGSPSPSPIADLESISSSLSKNTSPSVLGEDNDNLDPSPVVVGNQTYRILSLSELVNTNGANTQALAAAYEAYNTFLQTPNLQFMTPAQQQQIFTPILTAAIQKSLDQQKAQLQQQIDTINQQLYSNPPTSSQYYSQSSQAYQSCLNNKVASINNNPYLSESIRLSRIEKAKQDCANQN